MRFLITLKNSTGKILYELDAKMHKKYHTEER